MKTLKQNLLLTIASAALLLATGCQTTPSTTYKPGVDFTKYRTFALAKFGTEGPISDPTAPLRQSRAVQAGIRDTLTRKGFTEVKSDDADLLVKASGKFIADDPGVTSRETRTGILEIMDAKSKEVIWSNSRTRISRTTLSPEMARQLCEEMLAPFPPGPGK